MAFNPEEHLIQMKGKDYLPVPARVMWFREKYPNGSITTEIVSLDPILVKAYVYANADLLLSTGHAGAVDKGNAVWSGRAVEKAETAAIGRALGLAGFGTQFTDDEEDHLADSPVQRAKQTLGQGQNRRIPLPQDAPQPDAPKNAPAPLHAVKKASIVEYVQLEKGKGAGKFNYVLLDMNKGFIVKLFEGRLLRELGYPVDDWKADSAAHAKRYELMPMLQCEFQPDGAFVLSHLN